MFGNGLIVQFKKYVETHPRQFNTTYQHVFGTTKIGDVNNPYTYMLFGGLMIDEVTAEHVATEMVKQKYREPVLPKNRQRLYGKYVHPYKSHFEYYGVGEELIEQFSRTLFLKSNCRNLNGLAREIFKNNFVYDLIRQHNENPEAFQALVDKLAYLGVIGFSEEQYNGHRKDKEPVSTLLIRDSYESLQDIFREGREERENIPNNIPAPTFME